MRNRMAAPFLPDDATPTEIRHYVWWWRERGDRVCRIMGWKALSAFDPDFKFVVRDGVYQHLGVEVVEKLIELDDFKRRHVVS